MEDLDRDVEYLVKKFLEAGDSPARKRVWDQVILAVDAREIYFATKEKEEKSNPED